MEIEYWTFWEDEFIKSQDWPLVLMMKWRRLEALR